MTPKTPRFKVSGEVRDADGRPLADAPVKIFDKGLRSDVLLGETKTDTKGRYLFESSGGDFPAEDQERPSLYLRVFDPRGEALSDSPVLYRAREEEIVHINAPSGYRAPTEIDELKGAVSRRLKDSDGLKISLKDLDEGDIQYLAGDSGTPPENLAALVQAEQFSEATAATHPLPAWVFYAWLRQGLRGNFAEFFKLDLNTLQSALEAAPRDRIIPPFVAGQLEEVMAAVAALKADQTLNTAPDGGRAGVGDLLKGAVEDEGKRKKIAAAWGRANQADSNFWKGLEEGVALSLQEKERVRAAFEWGEATGFHLPLIRDLQALSQSDAKLKQPRDFSKWKKEDWKAALKKIQDRGETPFPADTLGENEDEKLARYADSLETYFETTYPKESLAARLEGDPNGPVSPQARNLLTKFFAEQTDFDIIREPLEAYLEKNPGAGPQNADELKILLEEGKIIQRLIKLTPRYEVYRELMKRGIHSSQGIVLHGRRDFLEIYKTLFGDEETAKKVFDKAEEINSLAIQLYAKHSYAFNSPLPYVIRGDAKKTALRAGGASDWRALFRSLDWCDCAHCTSVFSPAAYLADLLKFLEEAPPQFGQSPLQVLLKRRPELEHIELNCENANTPMPYVDLINEVLEDTIAPPNPTVWRQTTKSAEELAANPEHLNDATYRALSTAVYPWNLPFNLPLEEARIYLKHLGVARRCVLETMFPETAAASSLGNANIAWESLNLNATEAGIINGTITQIPGGVITIGATGRPWEFWGLQRNATIDDPLNPPPAALPLIGQWNLLLQRVDLFLRQSGLKYEELLGLLDTYYVNPLLPAGTRTLRLAPLSTDPAEAATCDPSRLKIEGLSEDALARIHRFVRLWRKLKWTMRDLDRAITALSPGNLGGDFLIRLSHVERLRGKTELPAVKLLGFWANLDSANYPGERTLGKTEASYYDQLYQNPAVLNPLETVFALNTARNELANPFVTGGVPDPTRTLLGNAANITAALKISSDDLDLLVNGHTPSAVPAAVADELNLANLSKLHRYAALAQTLKLTVRELLTLGVLIGDPFSAVAASTDSPARTATENTLYFIERVEKIRESGFSVAELDYFLRQQLTPGAPLGPTEEEIRIFLTALRDALTKSANLEGELIQRFSEALGLEMSVSDLLLSHVYMANSLGAVFRLRDPFLAPVFIQSDPAQAMDLTQAPFKAAADAFLKMQKISQHVLKFEIEANELPWAFNISGVQAGFDPYMLPVFPQGTVPGLFERWLRLVDLIALRNSLPGGGESLTEIFRLASDAATTEADLLAAISERLAWNPKDLQDLVAPNAFAVAFPAGYREGKAFRQLQAAFRVLKRLGVSGAQLIAWGKRNPTAVELADAAREIKQAAKSKYDEQEWLKVARPLRNPLRERQRESLVAYLSVNPKRSAAGEAMWRNAAGMSDYFLLDVEMSPCALTSRIKQAIHAVQWLMQRALMNLEPEINLDADTAKEWNQWRKQYRVWEANRKIFLTPENFIEPELRDDKTPFFVELEGELTQDELTEDTAETALRNYAERVWKISRLQPAGLFVDKKLGHDEGPMTIHLFSRAATAPRDLYYRKSERREARDPGSWTAWEKVDVDAEGDHLIPALWKGRLYLFWPIIAEVTDPEPVKPEPGAVSAAPRKLWQIQFAFSQLRHGKWSPKNLFKDVLVHPVLKNKTAAQSLTFRVATEAEQIRIECFGAVELPKPPQQPITRNGNSEQASTGAKVKGVVYDRDNLNKGIPKAGVLLISKTGKWKSYSAPGQGVSLWWEADFRANPQTAADGTYEISGIPPGNYELSAGTGSFDYTPTRYENTNFTVSANRTYIREYGFNRASTAPKLPDPPPDPYRSVMWQPIGDLRFRDWDNAVVTAGTGPERVVILAGTEVEGMGFRELPGRTSDNLYFSPYATYPVLAATPGRFRALYTAQMDMPGAWMPYFFEDVSRLYMFTMKRSAVGSTWDGMLATPFFHPYFREYLRILEQDGVDALFQLGNQRLSDSGNSFLNYLPDRSVIPVANDAREEVEFASDQAHSQYNWELFFHAPFLIACKLSQNQRFAAAQKWFHYIFDPTSADPPDSATSSGAERFWKFKPFHDYAAQDGSLMSTLMADSQALEGQIADWRKHPFQPHRIARLRIVAYMKAAVMKYIENLLNWGDLLFRRNTTESINEAAQVYMLAAHILGEKPEKIPPRAVPTPQTFQTIKAKLDDLSKVWVEIEDFVFPSGLPGTPGNGTASLGTIPLFCIPKNEKLLAYWATVSERLFNIRHCRNIEGREQQLPLFDPPIDPALLVRAAAAGVDLESALNDMAAPLPLYRFTTTLARALSLSAEVRSLGSSLLSILQTRDGERLALLRAGQESEMLKRVAEMKDQQVLEAKEAREALQKTREAAVQRYLYYQRLLGNPEARPPAEGETVPDLAYPPGIEVTEFNNALMTTHEKQELEKLKSANQNQVNAGTAEGLAGIMNMIPNIQAVSAPYGGGTTIAFGGSNLGAAGSAAAGFNRAQSAQASFEAAMSGKTGAYLLREADWVLQNNLALRELAQIDKQILAAKIREEIAKLDVENQRKLTEHASLIEDFLKDKFTNRELFDWMASQTASVYFQCYQLAYAAAKQAERAYRYELGLDTSNFIKFGYWDSLRKGLIAGEKITLDLRRLEASYVELNKREFEITKAISLVLTDPLALANLKANGSCEVELMEALFDRDYPGHYLRRVKSVALTIPCVTGPFTGVNATLTLLSHRTRKDSDGGANYSFTGPGDARFQEDYAAFAPVVSSSGQNDSGTFELNFRDERYLPFEGAGAIGRWKLELPRDNNLFDFSTISDVILQLRYTAREGVAGLKTRAQAALPRSGVRLFDVKREFPTEWHQMFHPAAGADQILSLPLSDARFPFHQAEQTVRPTRIEVLARTRGGGNFLAQLISPSPVPPATTPASATYSLNLNAPTTGRLYQAGTNLNNAGLGSWRLKLRRDTVNNFRQLKAEDVIELFLLCRFDLA